MFKIVRVTGAGETLFKLIGRMCAENIAEMNSLFGSDGKRGRLILDLKDLTLVDRDALEFLGRAESKGAKLVNCPLYIRDWIFRERNAK